MTALAVGMTAVSAAAPAITGASALNLKMHVLGRNAEGAAEMQKGFDLTPQEIYARHQKSRGISEQEVDEKTADFLKKFEERMGKPWVTYQQGPVPKQILTEEDALSNAGTSLASTPNNTPGDGKPPGKLYESHSQSSNFGKPQKTPFMETAASSSPPAPPKTAVESPLDFHDVLVKQALEMGLEPQEFVRQQTEQLASLRRVKRAADKKEAEAAEAAPQSEAELRALLAQKKRDRVTHIFNLSNPSSETGRKVLDSMDALKWHGWILGSLPFGASNNKVFIHEDFNWDEVKGPTADNKGVRRIKLTYPYYDLAGTDLNKAYHEVARNLHSKAAFGRIEDSNGKSVWRNYNVDLEDAKGRRISFPSRGSR